MNDMFEVRLNDTEAVTIREVLGIELEKWQELRKGDGEDKTTAETIAVIEKVLKGLEVPCKKYVATCVDYGETCDGKARVLGVFTNKVEAHRCVTEDMFEWGNRNETEGVEVDYKKMRAHYDYNTDDGCEWNVSEVNG